MDDLTRHISRDSGFQQNMGYKVEVGDGRAVATLEIAEHHRNRAGLLHGGVLMALFDSALGYASAAASREGEFGGLVTVSVTTNFVRAVSSGTVRVEAKRVGGGRKLIFASAEAYDENGDLLGTCSGTFRRLSQRPTA